MRTKRPKDKLVLDISDIPQGGVLPSITIAKRSGKFHQNVLRDIRELLKIHDVDEKSITATDPKSYGKGLRVVLLTPYVVCVDLAKFYNKNVVANQPLLIPTEEETLNFLHPVKPGEDTSIVQAGTTTYEKVLNLPSTSSSQSSPINISFEMVGDDVLMSTLQIAEFFNQDHKNVLADFRKFCENNDFRIAEFSAMRKAGNNRDFEVYNLPQGVCLMFVVKYDHRLIRVLVQQWRAAENKYIRLTSKLCSDPAALRDLANLLDEVKNKGDAKLIEQKAEFETKLIEQKAEFETKLIAQKEQSDAVLSVVLNANAQQREELSKLEAKVVVSKIRVKLNNEATQYGLVHTDDLGVMVKAMLGTEYELTFRPDLKGISKKPQVINQALIDLGYQFELPRDKWWDVDTTTGHAIRASCRYVPNVEKAKSKPFVVWGLKILERAGNEGVYDFSVTKTLHWSPALASEIADYMRKLNHEKAQLKAEKEQLKAQLKAEKAQLKAEKEQLKAQLKAEKEQLKAEKAKLKALKNKKESN